MGLLMLEAPSSEEEAGLMRFRCKAVQDDKEGWVALAGNKGSVFLEPVVAYYTCVKDTNLAEGVKVGDKTVRKVAKGENAQMVEAERKDEASGVMRMKVRMLRDGEVGWVTRV